MIYFIGLISKLCVFKYSLTGLVGLDDLVMYNLDLLIKLNIVGDYEVSLRVNIIQGPFINYLLEVLLTGWTI